MSAAVGVATHHVGNDSGERVWNIVDTSAPPERLAMLRMLVAGFVALYLALRSPVFWQLGNRRGGFDGVGIAALLTGPAPSAFVRALLLLTLVCGVATIVGWRYRAAAPAFALGVLALTSYRGSWGQLLHFENIFTLHLLVLALAPAADVWSLDARRQRRHDAGVRSPQPRDAVTYGWPIALCALVVVITYVIAGVAKLRYGGVDWVFGESLRNHVAYAAARNELVGVPAAPLADWAVRISGVWPVLAAAAVVLELGAPVALFGARWRSVWVVAVWLMHLGILLTMRIGFPYPLFLVAFAPFFAIERLAAALPKRHRPPRS